MRFYQVFALLIFAFVVLVLSSEAQSAHPHLQAALGVMTLFLYVPLGLLTWMGALLFRNRALRILLLRPFDENELTPALKRLVLKNFGPNGFVFTLSDRHYKPSVLARITEFLQNGPAMIVYLAVIYVFGPFLHNSKRLRSVSSNFGYRALTGDLRQNVKLNYWSLLSGDAAFNIRSADAWWQTCIHLLMNSSEIVVVDLSKVKPGMVWELERLQALGMLAKCIFMVSEANANQVAETLARHFPSGQPPIVHVYSSKGRIADRQRFDAQLHLMMKAGLA